MTSPLDDNPQFEELGPADAAEASKRADDYWQGKSASDSPAARRAAARKVRRPPTSGGTP